MPFQDTTESENQESDVEVSAGSNDDEPGSSGVSTAHALSKTNLLLETLVKKLDRQDQSISQLATALSSNGTSTPARRVSRQKEVPLQVRVSPLMHACNSS